jgi:hypothetical protein
MEDKQTWLPTKAINKLNRETLYVLNALYNATLQQNIQQSIVGGGNERGNNITT